jgi:phytoene synthase
LARKGLEHIQQAEKQRALVSKEAGHALLSGWQAKAILKQALRQPYRIAEGSLGHSEFRRRAGLIWRAGLRRW